MKLKDLKFGKEVLKGDSIPNKPFSDELRQVNNENDLKDLQSKFPDVEVVIDRDAAWFNQIQIPEWKEERKNFAKGKMAYLNS